MSYIPTDEMIFKLQQLKGQTKLKFFRKNQVIKMVKRKREIFNLKKILFSKNAGVFSKINREVLLLGKFL